MKTVKLRFLQDIPSPNVPIKKGEILNVKVNGHEQYIKSNVAEYVDEDTEELRSEYNLALDIIEGPLMEGMRIACFRVVGILVWFCRAW